eukprot:scaffold21256_cov40-Cyclotella_meneghiniana.AAC.1
MGRPSEPWTSFSRMSNYRLVDSGRGMRRRCSNIELSPQRNGAKWPKNKKSSVPIRFGDILESVFTKT